MGNLSHCCVQEVMSIFMKLVAIQNWTPHLGQWYLGESPLQTKHLTSRTFSGLGTEVFVEISICVLIFSDFSNEIKKTKEMISTISPRFQMKFLRILKFHQHFTWFIQLLEFCSCDKNPQIFVVSLSSFVAQTFLNFPNSLAASQMIFLRWATLRY